MVFYVYLTYDAAEMKSVFPSLGLMLEDDEKEFENFVDILFRKVPAMKFKNLTSGVPTTFQCCLICV